MNKRKQEVRAAIRAAQAQGCTCDVEVASHAGGHVSLAHDSWCPLMRVMNERKPEGRVQGVIYRPDQD